MNIIDVNTVYGAGTSSVFKNTAEDLEKYISSKNIGKAMTLSSSGINYNYAVGNQETFEDLKKTSRLIPVATIDPRGFFGDGKEIENIKSMGFKAVRFFPDIQNWACDNTVFSDIMKINSRVGLPFIVNAKEFGTISEFARVYTYDFPVIFSGVSYKNAAEFAAFAKKHKNVYAESSSFNAYYVLMKIIEETGTDRIVFGSGSSHNLADVSVDFINKADLSQEDKEKIFALNIMNILKEA